MDTKAGNETIFVPPFSALSGLDLTQSLRGFLGI